MSKHKCGLKQEERERFLKESGFVKLRAPKGGSSHSTWYNPEFKKLCQSGKAELPANFGCDRVLPWEITVCDNPARGTWKSLQKQVTWIKNCTTQSSHNHEIMKARGEASRAFRKAFMCYKHKRRLIKQLFKAGAKEVTSMRITAEYEQMKHLASLKRQVQQQLLSVGMSPS